MYVVAVRSKVSSDLKVCDAANPGLGKAQTIGQLRAFQTATHKLHRQVGSSGRNDDVVMTPPGCRCPATSRPTMGIRPASRSSSGRAARAPPRNTRRHATERRYIQRAPVRKTTAMNSPTDRAQIERWVATWREAEPALAEQKRRELEQLATPRALSELAAAFAYALQRAPLSDTSGLIDQQRYFQQLAR